MNKNLRTALIIGGIALAALIAIPMIWGGHNGYRGNDWGWGGMMGPGMMGGFGGGRWMVIFMILIPVLVIWGIVALVHGSGNCCASASSDRTDSAMEVLKRRYARGEINKQEFDEKKRDLS